MAKERPVSKKKRSYSPARPGSTHLLDACGEIAGRLAVVSELLEDYSGARFSDDDGWRRVVIREMVEYCEELASLAFEEHRALNY
jgi:hypothetical protein